ncbi:hypothetical protein NONO_c60860 [Nocardia nova SH22a]|uniref:Uncharacterized protein n=1 Tax=Nocardia nova SH22a TaxID=1415166 RepID=W5TNQ0_9NOCA|nr:hypothetical protein [Nocardia nova]AHH20862.1 hypothetical protein NONO_c60860 [Nocardia nova SH22a]
MDSNGLLRAAPITQENADQTDPRQKHAWALRAMPAPNKQMGDVPLYPSVSGDFSERLEAFGYVHDPTRQTLFVIEGDHPEAGYLNVPKLVDRKEYDEYLAARADTDAAADTWRATAEAALEKLDPKLLNRINAMTDEQKAAERERQKQQLPAAFQRLEEIAGNAQKKTSEETDGD